MTHRGYRGGWYIGIGDSGRPAALNVRLNHLLIRLAIRVNILLLQGHYWQGVKMQKTCSFSDITFLTPPNSHSVKMHMNVLACDMQWRCTNNLVSKDKRSDLLPPLPCAFSLVSRITPITVNTLSKHQPPHSSATSRVW